MIVQTPPLHYLSKAMGKFSTRTALCLSGKPDRTFTPIVCLVNLPKHRETFRMNSYVEDLRPLTSLRFVAAMMIVLLHAGLFFGPLWPWLELVPATAVQGVSFFFVLSGFILTHVYKLKPWLGYGRFIATRVARLWPLHFFATLLLFLFVSGGYMTYSGPGIFDRNFVLLFNLGLIQSSIPTTAYVFSWNTVSWSISTEYFFYLAFPFLLINIEDMDLESRHLRRDRRN